MSKDNVIEFPQSKDPEMSPEELKGLIETNQMLKYCLRIMNRIPLGDTYADGTKINEEDINYEELWNNVSLQQKVDAGEVTADTISFYYQLLSLGYDNFGSMFFYNMFDSENASYIIYALKCFIDYIGDLSNTIEKYDNELKELKKNKE